MGQASALLGFRGSSQATCQVQSGDALYHVEKRLRWLNDRSLECQGAYEEGILTGWSGMNQNRDRKINRSKCAVDGTHSHLSTLLRPASLVSSSSPSPVWTACLQTLGLWGVLAGIKTLTRCLSRLGLPSQNTVVGMASTTDVDFLTLLEAGKFEIGVPVGVGLGRTLFLACRRLLSRCVLIWRLFL